MRNGIEVELSEPDHGHGLDLLELMAHDLGTEATAEDNETRRQGLHDPDIAGFLSHF